MLSSLVRPAVVLVHLRWSRSLWVLSIAPLMLALTSAWGQRFHLAWVSIDWRGLPSAWDGPFAFAPGHTDLLFFA